MENGWQFAEKHLTFNGMSMKVQRNSWPSAINRAFTFKLFYPHVLLCASGFSTGLHYAICYWHYYAIPLRWATFSSSTGLRNSRLQRDIHTHVKVCMCHFPHVHTCVDTQGAHTHLVTQSHTHSREKFSYWQKGSQSSQLCDILEEETINLIRSLSLAAKTNR